MDKYKYWINVNAKLIRELNEKLDKTLIDNDAIQAAEKKIEYLKRLQKTETR